MFIKTLVTREIMRQLTSVLIEVTVRNRALPHSEILLLYYRLPASFLLFVDSP